MKYPGEALNEKLKSEPRVTDRFPLGEITPPAVAKAIISNAGANVKKIVCVLDRRQGAEQNIIKAGYKFESILTRDDIGIES